MGVNDAAEMLEVAKEECIRLERENAELRAAIERVTKSHGRGWPTATTTAT